MLAVFDIGGTLIKYALLVQDGVAPQFHHKGEMPTDAKRQGGPGIVQAVLDKAAELGRLETLDGVAISTAGTVNSATGEITGANENIPRYAGINWKQAVYERFRLPCAVENDVNAAVLGEYAYGAARGSASVLCVTVGTGVGGALILRGELLHGAGGAAGEVGYMRLPGGSFEELASTSALVARVRARFTGNDAPGNGREIFAQAREGNAVCREEIKRTCDFLAQGLANCCCLVNPECIVLGGGIMSQGDLLRPWLEEYLQRYLPASLSVGTRLAFAQLGNDAGMMGAAYLFAPTA